MALDHPSRHVDVPNHSEMGFEPLPRPKVSENETFRRHLGDYEPDPVPFGGQCWQLIQSGLGGALLRRPGAGGG
jgi:hypothetical protein